MLPLDALKSMDLMIATPCYASTVTATYAKSLFKLAYDCAKMGTNISLELRSESMVTTSRNRLVAQFLLNPNFTHLIWIDADVEFTSEAVARLLLADRDVVCGVYPLKRFEWPPGGLPGGMTREKFEHMYTPYPFNVLDEKLVSDEEGFGEVREATTGFMCIKRAVLERMVEAYPDLHYLPDDSPSADITSKSYLFFDTMHEKSSGRYLSEDYAFCTRWRAIGGKVWIDIHSKLNHQGQCNWRGDLYGSLQNGGARQWNRNP